MFADNEKISSRQCMRLLFFDFVGIGSLVLPGHLAFNCGTDGAAALLLGALGGVLYLWLLKRAALVMEGEILEFWEKRYGRVAMKIGAALYLVYYLLLGSYSLHLFTTLMMRTLLKEESYQLIALLALLLAGYGMCRGLECRSRVFEILFWFILIPLLLMLALGSADIQFQNLLPMGMADGASLLRGAYPVFLVFSLSQMLLHLGSAVPVKEGYRAAGAAIWISFGVFLFLYLVLLGVFGASAISVLDFPAVSLMSTVTIPGGFLRRQDAVMVSIWFFSLFALICSSFYYCCKGGLAVVSRAKKGRIQTPRTEGGQSQPESGEQHARWWKWLGAACVMAALYGVACGCYVMPELNVWLEKFFLWATPAYLLLPLLTALPKKTGKRLGGLALVFAVAVLGCGCSVQELENRSFPLAVGIGVSDGQCRLVYKFEDLSDVSSQDGVTQGSVEQDATASGFYPATLAYERENGKVMDLNHVKVMIFEQDFLEDEGLYQDFVAYMKQSQDISWNVLLFVTEDVTAVTDLQENMPEPIGTYLEEMLEGNSQLNEKNLVTLGSLLNDSSNRRKNLFLPYLTAKDQLPVQEGFYCVSAGRPLGRIDEEQGNLANIFTGTTAELELTMRPGCDVLLEDFDVFYNYGDDGRCLVRLKALASHYGSVPVTEEEIAGAIKEKLEGCFSDYLRNNGTDLTAGFDLLPLNVPEKARKFAGDKEAYDKQLRLSFDVEIELVQKR